MVHLGRRSTAYDVLKASQISLAGRTAIVTGGNAGIGAETVKALGAAGAKVIFTSRSLESGKAAANEFRSKAQNADIAVRQMDLTDLRSIRAFTEDINRNEERVDILVCNAGVMFCPQSYTPAGFEIQIGTNHFGHLAMVQQLLGKLHAQSFPSRIVVVASIAYKFGGLDIDDLHFRTRSYNKVTAYGQSKLANILFAKELAKRTPDHVSAFSVHPGLVMTDLGRHMVTPGSMLDRCGRAVAGWFLKRPAQGAATSMYAATWPGLEQHSGAYLADCTVQTPSIADRDWGLASRLWDETVKQLAEAEQTAG